MVRNLSNFSELKKTGPTRVMNTILESIPASFNNIRIYNDAVKNKIPKHVNNTTLQIRGKKITFSNTKIMKEDALLPSEVRKISKPYLLKILTTVDIGGIKNEIELGSIPLMLGSEFCPLSRMTQQERIAAGEDANDPFGYFIIGTEKFFVQQEKLRISNTNIFKSKTNTVEMSYTCPCERGTQLLTVGMSKDGTIVVYPPHFPDKTKVWFPIFTLFEIFEIPSDEAMGMIFKFIPPEERLAAQKVLFQSLIETKKDLNSDPDGMHFLKSKIAAIGKDSVWSLDKGKKMLLYDIFPQLDDVEDKFLHLSMTTAQIVRFLIGKRGTDNRDSWSLKRIDTGGVNIERLFMIIWANQKIDWETNLKNPEPSSFAYPNNLITKNFTISSNPNKWGFIKSKTKENIVDILKRDSPLTIQNQLTRISTPRDKNEKGSAIRMIQPSQLGYICLAESPEGDTIGLIKHNAASCIISVGKNPVNLIKMLNDEELESVISFVWSEDFRYPILFNGIIKGYTSSPLVVRDFYLRKRRKCELFDENGEFIIDTCIFWNSVDQQIQIYCDSSRPVRPLFVVNKESGRLYIEEAASQTGGDNSPVWDMQFFDLLKKGFVEIIDAREQESVVLCESLPHLLQNLNLPVEGENITSVMYKRNYDYCEIDPQFMFGIMSLLAPKANHEQAPRITYQAGMGKQALTNYNINHNSRFDTTYKVLRGGMRPLFEVEGNTSVGLNYSPNGQMLMLAMMALPNNAEDAIAANEDCVTQKSCGKLQYYKYFTLTEEVSLKKTDSGVMLDFPRNIHSESEMKKYNAIGENKLPKIGSYISKGDYILPRVSCQNGEKNRSIIAAVGEEGIVDRINVIISGMTAQIKIKFRKRRFYTLGAKACARYAQKGVIGDIIPFSRLPFVVSGPLRGITPDFIVNPHSLPSRMTMGLMYEYYSDKFAALTGIKINASSFKALFYHPYEYSPEGTEDFITIQEYLRRDVKTISEKLSERGYASDGLEMMAYDLGNGNLKLIPAKINVAPVFYHALKHHAEDKEQSRSIGMKDIKTQQPNAGRSTEGGLRFGEMERDALISHGASSALLECLFEASDKYRLTLCKNCGIIPVNNHKKEYMCRVCRQNKFCTIKIPYVMKCLIQSLAGCGVEVRFGLELLDKYAF